MRYLSDLKSLEMLDLYNTGVTNQGLKSVATLANLQSLGLDGVKVNDEGLAAISNLSKLEALSLADAPITDAGLARLAGLRTSVFVVDDESAMSATGPSVPSVPFPDARSKGENRTRLVAVGEGHTRTEIGQRRQRLMYSKAYVVDTGADGCTSHTT